MVVRSAARAQILRRAYSTAPANVTKWTEQLTTAPPNRVSDILDPRRARQLHRTLPTRTGPNALHGESTLGEPLPLGHHLVYFQPETPFAELGQDGSSTEYNAPAPYLRRMWAGGSFEWSPDRPLLIGQEVVEATRVSRVDFKKDMVFVHQEKAYTPAGVSECAVREIRTHVFRTDVGVKLPKSAVPAADVEPSPSPSLTFTYTPTSPLLFRYSALTFNGHKIHYDRTWTVEVENHPDLVVHGPLTCTLLVELAGKVARDRGKQLVRFDYRATSPMYVDRELRLLAMQKGEGEVEMVAEQEGRVGMKAVATLS